MVDVFRKLVGGACAVTLAVSLVPAPAFATVQAAVHAQEQLQARAQEVDAHEGSFTDGAIIVAYADGAAPSRRANAGLSVQSVSIAGIGGASAEVLSEDSGIPGAGASFHVDLPDGVSVGQAVAAAEADPAVVHAQPIFKYRLMDDPVQDEGPEGGASAASGAVTSPANAVASRAVATVLGAANAAVSLAAGTSSSLAPLQVPNDEFLKDKTNSGSSPNAWWIYSVKAPEAWDVAQSDNSVAVAILDTGINFTHEDLKDNILVDYAWDSYLQEPLAQAETAQPTSAMSHGSHVAGIVAARANNFVGTAGVSYNANILPICVFHEVESMYGSQPTCDDEDLIRAYDYLLSDDDGDGRTIAQETNTRVVNMSLGGYIADDPSYEYDYEFEAKIEQAQDAGILTVAAAGNGDGYGNPRTDASYPSDYEAVMSVIALQTDTQRAYWSDKNDMKNISAPGVDIYSTWYYGNQYHFDSGTSMASPLVAGGAALLWAYNPELSVADVKQTLYSTADDLGADGFDPEYGWGRMNLQRAVAQLGTVMVKAEESTMMRTATQQMSAQVIANASEQHEWAWSVSDASVARITDDGKLTALQKGTVEVRVQAKDDASLTGKRTVTIEDIHIPGGITASANPAENTIALQWSAAEAAVSYEISRANAQEGPYSKLTEQAAAAIDDGQGQMTYLDRTARPSTEYWYKVVPVGSLDGQAVPGLESNAAHAYYTDKTALRNQIAAAESLLSSTKTSVDGSNISTSEYWVTVEERTQLNAALREAYSAYYSGALKQDAVDAATAALSHATDAFSSARQRGTDGASNVAPAQPVTPSQPATSGKQVMYRLYNPNSGEHFYTANASERDHLKAVGWKMEGAAWNAPSDSATPVYRLYNPNAGDHHYTTSAAERSYLVRVGWRNEGIGWLSDDAKGVAMYRLYNPNAVAGAHHYTASAAERDHLVKVGWKAEGTAWYGVK